MQIKFSMLLLFISGILCAQNEPIAVGNLDQSNSQILRNHISKYYNVPHEAFNDSTIYRISYQIKFVVNEEGRVENPEIIKKNVECKTCELELLKVIKTAPVLKPYIIDDHKYKAYFILPFTIQIQD